jgi:hypothetical protein
LPLFSPSVFFLLFLSFSLFSLFFFMQRGRLDTYMLRLGDTGFGWETKGQQIPLAGWLSPGNMGQNNRLSG